MTPTTLADPLEALPPAAAGERRVLADRVAQLYNQLLLALLMTFGIGAVAAFELWEAPVRELVTAWWGLVLVVTLAGGALLYAYRRSASRDEDADAWLRWYGIAALAMGTCWGILGAVFFPAYTDAQQVFLAFLLAGMMSAGIPLYATSWPVFAAYAGGIVVPFTYVLFTLGNRLLAELALLVPVFYALSVGIAYRLNRVFDAGYRLRGTHERLAREHCTLDRQLRHRLAELAETRRALEASDRKLALFAERAPIAVLELDPEATIVEVNPQAEVLFGYSAAELTGRNLRFLVRPEFYAEFDAKWRRVAVERSAESGVIRTLRRDGTEVLCEWTVSPLLGAGGETVAVLALGRHITSHPGAAGEVN